MKLRSHQHPRCPLKLPMTTSRRASGATYRNGLMILSTNTLKHVLPADQNDVSVNHWNPCLCACLIDTANMQYISWSIILLQRLSSWNNSFAPPYCRCCLSWTQDIYAWPERPVLDRHGKQAPSHAHARCANAQGDHEISCGQVAESVTLPSDMAVFSKHNELYDIHRPWNGPSNFE